jgi:DNA polymerase-4
MMEQLENIASTLEKRLKKHSISGKTVTLKIKYSDFTQQTRSKTFILFLIKLILETVKELLYQERMKDSVRLGYL